MFIQMCFILSEITQNKFQTHQLFFLGWFCFNLCKKLVFLLLRPWLFIFYTLSTNLFFGGDSIYILYYHLKKTKFCIIFLKEDNHGQSSKTN